MCTRIVRAPSKPHRRKSGEACRRRDAPRGPIPTKIVNPIMVISGRGAIKSRCPLLPQQRTLPACLAMRNRGGTILSFAGFAFLQPAAGRIFSHGDIGRVTALAPTPDTRVRCSERRYGPKGDNGIVRPSRALHPSTGCARLPACRPPVCGSTRRLVVPDQAMLLGQPTSRKNRPSLAPRPWRGAERARRR